MKYSRKSGSWVAGLRNCDERYKDHWRWVPVWWGHPCWVHPGLVGPGSLRDGVQVGVWPPSSQSFVPLLLGRDMISEGWGPCSWDLAKGVCMDEKLSQAPEGKPSTLAVWFVLSGVSLWLPWPKTLSPNGPGTERLGSFWQLLACSEPQCLNLLQGWEPAAPWSERRGNFTCARTWKGGTCSGRKWSHSSCKHSISSRLGDHSHDLDSLRN